MLSRSFLVLWLAMFTAIAGIAMVSPLLPVYVREDLGGPEIAVALSFSALALSQLATSPFIGRLGDRFGYKRFIVGGFVIYAIGAIGYVFSNTWELVVFFRAFSGIGAAGIFPMALAYVGRIAPPAQEGRYMGVFAIAMTTGYGIGTAGRRRHPGRPWAECRIHRNGGDVAGRGRGDVDVPARRSRRRGGWQTSDDDDTGPALPWSKLLRVPRVQATMLGQSLFACGQGASLSYIAVYVVGDDGLNTGSAAFVGLMIAARSTVGSSFQWISGLWADKYSRSLLAFVGFTFAAVAQFILPDISPTPFDLEIFGFEMVVLPWLLLLFFFVGVGEAIALPAINAVMVEAGRKVGMGAVTGTAQMGQSAGFLGGSVIGALVVELWGLEAVFRYAGIVVVLGAVLFVLLMRRAPEPPPAPPGGRGSGEHGIPELT
ncbi:MAG: MFS transporter [Dehalococcoidia bacterium]|nr:MFS transporter [Dehalococcoidia bacterium]